MNSDLGQAGLLAGYLLEIQAIKLNPENPFQWASGWLSPIYCDNRKTLSVPKVRDFIKQAFVQQVNALESKPDIIAGVATGGIAIGALVADELDLPYVYVRASAKGHGLGNRIEGGSVEGKKVLVIEDLVSTGMSSISAIDALREAGADVDHMLSIFTYGFDVAINALKNAKINFHSLTELNNLLEVAMTNGELTDTMHNTMNNWRKDPANWGKTVIK